MTGRPRGLVHWGAFEAEVEGGRLVAARPLGGADPQMIAALPAWVHSPLRIGRPHVREDWLRHRTGKGRGRGRMVPIGWDEALDLLAGEVARVRGEHGAASVCAGSYGWSSAGRLHHARTQLRRCHAVLGGFTDQVDNYSWGAAARYLPHALGDAAAVTRAATSWASIAGSTDVLVAFGGLAPRNWRVTSGGAALHGVPEAVARAAARGTRFWMLSPDRADAPEGLEAEWIAPRPGSDAAIMLGLTRRLIETGRADRAFLARFATGFEAVEAYLADGPKDLAWAARIADVPLAELERLARAISTGRVMLTASWSLQRARFGEQTYAALIALACALGQVGLPGGGFSFGYGSMNAVGGHARPGFVPSVPVPRNPVPAIPVARIADALLRPGETIPFDGGEVTYPDIRLLHWAGGNPFHHHQDLRRLERAWARPETVVVQEPWWTPTARRADIVLPATTALERNDIGGSSRDPFVTFMLRLIPPVGHARDDRDMLGDLAQRLGARDAFDEGLDEEGWLRRLWSATEARAAAEGIEAPGFDAFREAGRWRVPEPEAPEVYLSAFRGGTPLRTPSGRIELAPASIARLALSDHPAHAAWLEPEEWLGAAAPGELHLLTHQPPRQLHSQLGQVAEKGPARVRLHPEDARVRGVEDGAVLRLWNARGECLARARIDPRVRPGVAMMPTGAWLGEGDGPDPGGNPNVLTADRPASSLSQACAAHSTLVRLEPVEGASRVVASRRTAAVDAPERAAAGDPVGAAAIDSARAGPGAVRTPAAEPRAARRIGRTVAADGGGA